MLQASYPLFFDEFDAIDAVPIDWWRNRYVLRGSRMAWVQLSRLAAFMYTFYIVEISVMLVTSISITTVMCLRKKPSHSGVVLGSVKVFRIGSFSAASTSLTPCFQSVSTIEYSSHLIRRASETQNNSRACRVRACA